jgi:hypothetical protein
MKIKNLGLFLIVMLMLVSPVFAGVGIKWDKESVMVNEQERTCLTYSVYNPWPENTYVEIAPSEEFNSILIQQDIKDQLIPANTSSSAAIPIEFCFKTPIIYKKDCLVGSYMCMQECKEERKDYTGKILVKSVAPPTDVSGAGGSATTMSVSAPLNVKIRCNPHSRDFTPVYIIIAIISLLIIGFILYSKYKTPKLVRDKERLKKLQEQIKKEKSGKK